MRPILYTLLFISVIGCNSNTIIKKPKNLISKDIMVDVLTDSYIAKAAQKIKNINGDRDINYQPFVYQKYGIDSITFNQSLKYYISDISLSEDVFKKVKDNIELQIKELESDKKKKD